MAEIDVLGEIVARLDRLETERAAAPRLRWATVTGTDPLRILIDGDAEPMAGTPASTTRVLVPGERVRVEIQNRRVTVIAVAGRPQQVEGTTDQRQALEDAGVRLPDGTTFFDVDEQQQYGVVSGVLAVADPRKAQLAAAAAAELAAEARTTALGSARYQYIDDESLFIPELPVEGPGVGAERIRRDTFGAAPYQVDVWDGTQWNFAQYLASELLVLGEDGLVRIKNGGVDARSVSAEFYYGGKYYGSEFDGARFKLTSTASVTEMFYDPCETAGVWKDLPLSSGAGNLQLSSVVKKAGTYSVRAAQSGGATDAWRPISGGMSFPNGGYVTAWVYLDAPVGLGRPVSMSLMATDNSLGPTSTFGVFGGVWTELRVEVQPGGMVRWIGAYSDALGTLPLYVDEVRGFQYSTSTGEAGMIRAASGRAEVYSKSNAGNRTVLTPTGVELISSSEAAFTMGRVFTGSDAQFTAFRSSGLSIVGDVFNVINTSTNKTERWTRFAGYWAADVLQAGSHPFSGSLAASGSISQAITFASSYAYAPAVHGLSIEVASSALVPFATQVTEYGFTLRVRNLQASAVNLGAVTWFATGERRIAV